MVLHRQPPIAVTPALSLFNVLPGDLAVRDAQDLMAYPFFSLAKSKRTQPIEFRAGEVELQVQGTLAHGLATIWDADVLIWAASHLMEARDAGLPTSRRMVASPFDILTFTGRGTSTRDYRRLRAAMDRLQSTSVATSLRQGSLRRLHRFSWVHEWVEHSNVPGRAHRLEMILPDWFYRGIVDEGLVLTLDAAYFSITGGIERWLYRLVRKHAGRQVGGWQFDFRYLHRKSGSAARFSDFAIELRRIAMRQPLPGYRIAIERELMGPERLSFYPVTVGTTTVPNSHERRSHATRQVP